MKPVLTGVPFFLLLLYERVMGKHQARPMQQVEIAIATVPIIINTNATVERLEGAVDSAAG